jgi:hypothetical protein
MTSFTAKTLGAIALSAMVSTAGAATASYSLTNSNTLADGNYGTVTLSDGADASNSEYVDFTVEINSDAFGPYGDNFGMDKFYFNYNDELAGVDAELINTDPESWSIRTRKNAGGGFGFFDFEAKGTGHSRTLVLNFSIAGVDGDTIADYAIAGTEGFLYAAHIGGFGEDGEMSTKVSAVPVPAAVWLLGSALGGLGFMRRKQAKS